MLFYIFAMFLVRTHWGQRWQMNWWARRWRSDPAHSYGIESHAAVSSGFSARKRRN